MRTRRAGAGLAVVALSMLMACGGELTSTLSGGGLAGTWKTALPVTFSYTSDFCGRPETIGQSAWTVTWVVSKVAGNANAFDVSMSANQGAFQRFATSCGSATFVPFVTPFGFRLIVSSTAMSASDPGNGLQITGSYTSDLMMATWIRSDCLLYCSGEFTASNALKLVRQ